jgi:uncharacterized membrane protein YphA (DoxX/SURF4 family)
LRRLNAGDPFSWTVICLLYRTSIQLNLMKNPAILIRLMVGAVFISEGIQKFLFSDALGVGRFAKIGIPVPWLLAPFVGCVEIACGGLLILGIRQNFSAIPLLGVISVAILTTKLPMLTHQGFWSMAHEARGDYCMLMGLLFLIFGARGRAT